jgi:hypothetical protein
VNKYSPYPNILFHFTNSPGLKGIISERRFRLAYARERIENTAQTRVFGVPQVSFCDLRLSELPFHMKKYGKFGIGLTKKWALRSGLNPVAYVNKSSEFTNNLLNGIDKLFKHLDTLDDYDESKELNSAYMNIFNVIRHIKNYEGDLVRNGANIGFYRFADEREWRYVPSLLSKIIPVEPENRIDTKEKKKALAEFALPHALSYAVEDISYIIVPAEKNIRPIKQLIQNCFHEDEAKMEHLLTRILTAEQISADM